MKLILKFKYSQSNTKIEIKHIYSFWKYLVIFYLKHRFHSNIPSLNLQNPEERLIAQFSWFYNLMEFIDSSDWIFREKQNWMLYDTALFSEKSLINEARELRKQKNVDFEELLWSSEWTQWMWSFWLWYYEIEDVVNYWYIESKSRFHIQWIEQFELNDFAYEDISVQEFHLLMQIFFWVYDDEKLKNTLEENDKNWKYEMYKHLKYDDFANIDENETLEEYFTLLLTRKDISWAFENKTIWIDEYKRILKQSQKKLKYIEKIKQIIPIKENLDKSNTWNIKEKYIFLTDLYYKLTWTINDTITHQIIMEWSWNETELKLINQRIEKLESDFKRAFLEVEKEEILINQLREATSNIEKINNWESINFNFPKLKIQKIYDKNWEEDKKKIYLDKIKNYFWEEVIIE